MAAVDGATLPSGGVRGGRRWRQGEAALHRLGLAEVIDRSVDQLSGGQEKRVSLARALVADADLLVLDEPTNHLDVDAINWLEHELERALHGRARDRHPRSLRARSGRHQCARARPRVEPSTRTATTGISKDEPPRGTSCGNENTRRIWPAELAWLRTGAKARTRKSKARIERATALINTRAQAAARDGVSISTRCTRAHQGSVTRSSNSTT